MTRVYLLGVGAIGMTVANGLALAEPALVQDLKLILRTKRSLHDYGAVGHKITVNTIENSSKIVTNSTLFDAVSGVIQRESIENLIVATKAHQVDDALTKTQHLISSNTNIILLQNGMGVADKLVKRLWPVPSDRPTIYECVNTHGCYTLSPFVANHVGIGTMKFSKYRPFSISKLQENYCLLEPEIYKQVVESITHSKDSLRVVDKDKPEIIQMLEASPTLNASEVSYQEFILAQMEKLVVNACINPLTAVMDCENGELLNLEATHRIMKRVVHESVQCLKAEYSHLSDIDGIEVVLNEDRLLNRVFEICRLTAKNSSSMREDVKNLKPTELGFINGYISQLGQIHGISTNTNNLLILLVGDKLRLERNREDDALTAVLDEVRKV